jgi:UPF0042 nucleotide-binding protein
MIRKLDAVFGSTPRERQAIFIDCHDEQLERRYTENCRPHPIAGDRPVMDGIRLERRAISTLRGRADLVVDTSDLTVAERKRLFFLLRTAGLRVFIISFAYRHGTPRDADLIFDVRFLENPHLGRVPSQGPPPRNISASAHIECEPGLTTVLDASGQVLRNCSRATRKKVGPDVPVGMSFTGGEHRSAFAKRSAAQLRGAGFRAELTDLDLPCPALPCRCRRAHPPQEARRQPVVRAEEAK